MMNSSANESPRPKRNLHDSRNITILPPEITSTPFISNKANKVASPLITPTRKFLGARRYALSNNGMLNPVKIMKDPPGPLLASTAYNLNVSTYIDTKSPGYTGRLVQYNEESSRKQQQTHQEKYGSPGLFPIVHLFKKDVPVVSPKLKKGTIRIGTPESRSYYSQEHNRLLLEGIVRNNSILKEQNNSNDVSTRSVLDALKEISRKRIHANEEYDPIDDSNKKFRKTNGDGDYSKRNRVESPPSEKTNSSPTTQAKKRLCTIDAVLASKTSSMYGTFEGGTKRKSNEDSSNRILPVNKKKYNNVETQTLGTPAESKKDLKVNTPTEENKDKKNEKVVEKSEVIEEISAPPKQVLKVLDDKPLEVIRKNRLGALLSALSGREIPSIPMEDRRKALDQEWPVQSSDKPLVSILSSQNKQIKSDEKHVTFNIHQSTQSSQFTSSTLISENNSSITDVAEKPETTNTALNEKLALISSSGSVSVECAPKSINLIGKTDNNVSNTYSTNQKLDSTQTNTDEKEKNIGGFKFDLSKPLNINSNISSTPQMAKMAGNNAKPEIKSSLNFSSPSSTAPSLMFGTPSSKSESGSVSTFETSFTKSPSAAPTTNSLGLPTSLPIASTLTAGASNISNSFTFGTKPASEAKMTTTKIDTKTTAVFTFGKKETLQSGSGTSSMPVSLNSTTALTADKTESSGTVTSPFGSKTIASVGSAPPVFPFKSMNNISTISAKSVNALVTCSSLTTSTILNAPSFCSATSPVSTVSSVSTLGVVPNGIFSSKTLSTNATSSETSKTNLETSSNNPGGFKFSSGNSLPAFGSAPASSIPSQPTKHASNSLNTQGVIIASSKTQVENSSITSNPFVSAPVNAVSPSPMFGNNSACNASLTSDKKTFNFGSSGDQNNAVTSPSTISAFIFKTSQSGVTTTNTSASTASKLTFATSVPSFDTTSNMFSPSKNDQVTTFGAPTTTPSFGAPTTTPSFGAPTTTSSFGTSNSFTFGKPNTTSLNTASSTSLFGTTSTPSFGTTNTPSFGNSNTPNFVSTNTTSFGTTNTPSFGTTNTPSFGATNAPSFGSTANNSTFGTTSTIGFGTTNTPSFSTANTFGTSNTPSFGSTNTPSFGNNNTSAFGSTNTPAFGASNITSSSTNNVFGATNTAVTGFGTNNSTFGTPKSTGFDSSNTSTFGNATTTSSFVKSFSSPSTLTAPSFGNPSSPFGNAVVNNANTFNSNNTSSPFGNTSSTNSFGTFNANNNQFTAATSTSGFGTNTNNNFGTSSGTNAFGTGGNATNTFGSSNTSSPFGVNNNSGASNAFGSNFVKKPEQSSSIFPATTNNMFNNSSTFGSAPTNNNGTGGNSSSGVFTFGSSNTNAPSSGGVFTFGGTEPTKTFNFSASGTSESTSAPSSSAFNSVPSFAQPGPAVPNMFSIGSGNTSSSQARGRPLVRARRRT